MNLNRRNVLIGIATVAMITGAALGSGAFTSVEADRTMDIGLANDDAAILEIGGNSSLVTTEAGTDQQVLAIDLNELNDDATTTLSPAFYIHNEMGETVGVTITGAPTDVTMESNNNGQDLSSNPTVAGDDHMLNDGETVSVDVIIDTTNGNTFGDGTITIEANTSLAP